jgi:2-keto-3-deoxy-L-rhamnonate aldolase RhmA
MNAIKDSIKSRRTVVGTTAGPNVDVSILADAGYDFLLFDTQHSAWEIKQLQPSPPATCAISRRGQGFPSSTI